MPGISLAKLLDGFILPIFLVIGGKYISALFINLIFSFDWRLSTSSSQVFSLPFVQYSNLENLIVANSASSLFMSLVLAVGFTWVIFRFQHFHENYVTPKIASNLHSQKMEYLIIDEVRSHHQITIWFSLAWFTFLLVLLEFLAGSIALFVLITNLTIVLFLSVVILFDMHKKAAIARVGSR